MAFFDKVGASISKMGSDVSSKTKSMVEVTNINGCNKKWRYIKRHLIIINKIMLICS